MSDHAASVADVINDLHGLAEKRGARLGVQAMHPSGGGPIGQKPGVLVIEIRDGDRALLTPAVQAGPQFLAEARALFLAVSGGMF